LGTAVGLGAGDEVGPAAVDADCDAIGEDACGGVAVVEQADATAKVEAIMTTDKWRRLIL
jgi:hypothetical protein